MTDATSGVNCIQFGTDNVNSENVRDNAKVENDPGMFAAEQTWPTEAEIKQAQQARKGSMNSIDSEDKIPEASGEQIKDLGAALENM